MANVFEPFQKKMDILISFKNEHWSEEISESKFYWLSRSTFFHKISSLKKKKFT